jgi:hypothetical protein
MSSTKARNTARKLIKHIERQTIVANKRMEVLKAGKKDSIHFGKSLKGQRRQFQRWLDVIKPISLIQDVKYDKKDPLAGAIIFDHKKGYSGHQWTSVDS